MSKLSKIFLISQLAILSTMHFHQAESLWEKTTKTVSDTASKVADTVSDTTSSDTTSKEEARHAINNNTQKALTRLFKESKEAKEAKELYNMSPIDKNNITINCLSLNDFT